ncbi:3-deoxy-8-phosphooctulonate synthase [Campylobacter sp. LR291e]|uniref:3-deoxy-8-phosphooctulonate synthase n=1 Tax=unclassified Campylobacter TaxID=2593542 RepID=UPI00123827E5|nr:MULTISPECIES: 3-deoxy-8-phosphooctulonate synthase [unclassified Campylobacter]KAA6227845.1 3-deoxy-8-phosphooctulonate synthase [Campylobacter sp. LR185c]KAA6228253.1 3-deoxy-8-phosphooctulonate synthase [Campylobacter sp. LR196d]KAA6229253.1 3-deoxy-8-phosphooctulonate synthase [Campylobacter sp. LR291e]KAA6231059.1 3-deoxy-8-phosphooctulonate synthase [Campylobacter sp. LR264d]KAA8604467.1 3-deoxy-8-phosphooctulonate synthase [Campylobacter sp. LR185c]
MQKMILIAGPCVIESKDLVFKVAKELESFRDDERIDFYFKSSFDKANRTSINSFRGPGIDDGLKVLESVKKEFNMQILTDIHENSQAEIAANVADVLQIPAFLCRQTDLLVSAARTRAKINIKKGQFLNPYDIKYSVKKVLQTRGIEEEGKEVAWKNGVFVAERGSSFGYGNLVVDMRSLVIMREFAPVVFDATHSVQMPGAAGGSSGGKSEFVEPLARAAAGVGVDGFFFETHINPCDALCDGLNMLDIKRLKKCVESIFRIQDSLNDLY